MSPFKTKKLPKQVLHAVKKPSFAGIPSLETDIDTPPKKLYGPKIFFIILFGGLAIFFLSQVAIEAFKGQEKNGSENAKNTPIITEMTEIFNPQKIEGTMNILIAGIGGRWHEWSDLTDSIMLASLDSERDEVTLLSIPRDLFVAYPDRLWAGRINSLYDLGKRNNLGVWYLRSKITEITGQTIDKYIVIDFNGFTKMVDALGGINIDVPEDLVDKEYPDNNWWYETFIVRAWLQTFNGEIALKYARSRHSTSDFDRSERQQLIIKAIKEKATDLGVITDTDKIGEIYTALTANIDSDMSLVEMAKFAYSFSDVKSEDISIVNLSDSCLSVTKCQPGSYLYAPSRELFGGNAVMIPENAYAQKLSYYKDIRTFVDLTFRFPDLRGSPREIVFIYDPKEKSRAQEIALGLAKLWFPVSFEKALTVATGSIDATHVNVYWHEELQVGINPDSPSVEALRYIEPALPISLVTQNEYINTAWPRIEIVIWKDADEYFKDIKYPYYIPAPPKSNASGEISSGTIKSGSTTNTGARVQASKKNTETVSWEKWLVPRLGDWENF
jgi:LCP family protein required for cell wall assembly